MYYKKCNPQDNYGWQDLIFEVLTQIARPASSSEMWAYAVDSGLEAKLWVNGRERTKTPRSTFYARVNEQAAKARFLNRSIVNGGYVYALIPGQSPSAPKRLDYRSRDCYVYQITDPITAVPLYIGMGRGARKDTHLTVGSHNEDLNIAIQEMRVKGREPRVILLKEKLTRGEAYKWESAYIETYGRRRAEMTGVLFNHKRGTGIR